jgi:RNA polymerase sigma-70 factor (ECF subfamily)
MFFNYKKHEKVVMNHQKRAPKSSNYETPEYLLVEKEFLVKIEEAISTLPEKQKEVFLLSRIENKKYKEIAGIVGISVKAVEKRMHLALLKMKDKIGDV